MVRLRVRTAAGLLAATLVATGCTSDADPATDPVSSPEEAAPTLEAAWSSDSAPLPVLHGGDHWMATLTADQIPAGRAGSTPVPGVTVVADARTGTTQTVDISPERFWCLSPRLVPDSGKFAVMWPDPDGPSTEPVSRALNPCTELTVVDGATGEVVWQRDLDQFASAEDSHRLRTTHALGADDDVVVLTDGDGNDLCFDAADGTDVDAGEEACRTVAQRLWGKDLPTLTLPSGEEVALDPPAADSRPHARNEVGRTDNFLLVRDSDTEVVRAHDLATGETAWERPYATDTDSPELADDSRLGDERWFMTAAGVARVSYDGNSQMVVTSVEVATGEDADEIARIEQAWFVATVGDVLVALSGQGAGSPLVGFQLP